MYNDRSYNSDINELAYRKRFIDDRMTEAAEDQTQTVVNLMAVVE
jgi:O-methyltransferase involved in polyketide biosynthesis